MFFSMPSVFVLKIDLVTKFPCFVFASNILAEIALISVVVINLS